jgi:calcineurin-like phosphoesterase family protein
MRRFLFLGDTHGALDFVESAAKLAQQHDAEIVQAGDFGFLWPGNDQLEEVSAMLTDLGVTLRFIDGNHDDHPRLRGHVRACVPTTIASNVIYQPRGSVHVDEDGTRFLFLGGAPSIDRWSRVTGESWWPEEVITDAEFDLAMKAEGRIHVLVTHDAPDYPPGFSPKGTPEYKRDQTRSMKCVDALIRRHRPTLSVHGHWHTNYVRQHTVGTIVTGLNCNELDPEYLDDATLLWSRDAAQTQTMDTP